MKSRGLACSLVGLVACASAGVSGGGDDGPSIDAPRPTDGRIADAADPDAPGPDAGPIDVTLTRDRVSGQTSAARLGLLEHDEA